MLKTEAIDGFTTKNNSFVVVDESFVKKHVNEPTLHQEFEDVAFRSVKQLADMMLSMSKVGGVMR